MSRKTFTELEVVNLEIHEEIKRNLSLHSINQLTKEIINFKHQSATVHGRLKRVLVRT